jgi:dTDP-L-rhamnose 4-epimerase
MKGKHMKVLIIGGAGFIGSHTADALAKKGYSIRILDVLSPKTHGDDWPTYLDSSYEKILGDVRDREVLEKALEGVDYVYHLAAQMDLMPIYSTFFDVNVTSNALLYEIIVAKKLPIKKVIVASSQFVYGEGRWNCEKDGDIFPGPRSVEQLDKFVWDPLCPRCGGKIIPTANEEYYQDPPNQYAISKYTQELFSLKIGKLQNIPSVAMRYSIVHGPRQSLKNAYSGALRTFTMKIMNGETLATFEDNLSTRDFVSIHDVARANVLVLENDETNFQAFNVGGGKGYTVKELAEMIGKYLNKDVKFAEKTEYRLGDTRHAVSDISKLKKLGWKPEVSEEETVKEYLDWVKEKGFDISYLHEAEKKMREAGVVKGS